MVVAAVEQRRRTLPGRLIVAAAGADLAVLFLALAVALLARLHVLLAGVGRGGAVVGVLLAGLALHLGVALAILVALALGVLGLAGWLFLAAVQVQVGQQPPELLAEAVLVGDQPGQLVHVVTDLGLDE